MKRIVFILVFCLTLPSLFAQKSRVLNEPTHDERAVHFGFCIGLNVMDFIVHTNYAGFQNDTLVADVSQPVPGFHIQIITNYRLAENLDLRFLPGISFGQRTLNYFKGNTLYNSGQKLESNYLEFPFLLKYKAKRTNNFRPYLVSGVNLRADLAKTMSEDDQIFLDLKFFNYFYEIGAGIDFYLPYFKFSTELKFSYGINNALNRRTTNQPQYQNAIERLNSTLIMLSFHFE